MKKFIVLLLVVTLAVFCFCSCNNSNEKINNSDDSNVSSQSAGNNEQNTNQKKHITIIVVDNNNGSKSFEADTTSETLGDVLDELSLAQGEESTYGLFITTVNGITVNPDNQEWWCLTKGGESVMTGVDSTPISDGDVFELTFTVGY